MIESQITADMGKTLTESGGELDGAIGYLRFAAAEGRRREGDVNPNGVPGRMSFTLRGPLGVVGVITAWSFPVAIPLWKLAAALLTGNTCVWKPASATAMTGTLLADALDRAGLLPGVLNLVHGRGSVTGDAIVHAPSCGSCPSQARLGQGCRSPLALRRAVGAPSSRWAARTRPSCWRTPISSWPLRLWSLARLRPQGNAALRRAGSFVESSVRDEFAQLLTEGARRLRCGDGCDPETDVGPPIDAQSRTKSPIPSRRPGRVALRSCPEGHAFPAMSGAFTRQRCSATSVTPIRSLARRCSGRSPSCWTHPTARHS